MTGRGSDPRAAAGLVVAASDELVRCGAELVELAETYYVRVFRVTLTLIVALVVLMAPTLALLPGSPLFALASLAAIGCVCVVAQRSPLGSYRLLRGNPALVVACVALVAIAIAIDDPKTSPLWLVAFGPLTLSMLSDDGRLTATCAFILILGCETGVVLHGHLHQVPDEPVLVLQALGYAMWGLLFHGTINGGATSVLRLAQHMHSPPTPLPPRRVRVWPSSQSGRAGPTASPAAPAPHSLPTRPDPTITLTTRQLEVVALLCDGLRQHEIAEALAISRRQVQRHVRDAKNRTGAQTTAELVTMARGAGLVPVRTGE